MDGFFHAVAASALSVLVGLPIVACGGSRGTVEADESLPPLHHTFATVEALAEAVLAAVADGDEDRLLELALSEAEFRSVVWPELPASRPERGVPFEYAWSDLRQKSSNARRRLVARLAGQRFRLRAVDFEGGTTPYETFVVHRDSRLLVVDADGHERFEHLFGSVLQRGDEYKLFSYVVD